MVQLDRRLLIDARRLVDAANGHRLKEMVFGYEQAVDLHNRRYPGHETYRMQSELRLRKYVLHRQTENIRQLRDSAVECAERAAIKSGDLTQHYDLLQNDFDGWSRAFNKIRRVA
jgi:hypothetical protein